MSEEAFSVTLWACSAYAAVTPAVGMSNRCCLRLLYLDPTYCQISSTLHISLSELEQVALYFTSPHSGARTASNPAAQRRHRRPTPAIGCATPAIGSAMPAIGGATPAIGGTRGTLHVYDSGVPSDCPGLAFRIVGQP